MRQNRDIQYINLLKFRVSIYNLIHTETIIYFTPSLIQYTPFGGGAVMSDEDDADCAFLYYI